MTKDFKKQAASDNAFGQYGLGWMVGGITIGLLIGAGMYALASKGNIPAPTAATATQDPANVSASLTGTAAGTEANPPSTQAGNATLQDVSAPAEEPPSEDIPGFSYHAVLPQLEIDIPLSVQAEQQAAAKPADDKKKEAPATAKQATDKKAEIPPPAPAAPVAVPTGFNGFQIGSYKTAAQAADMQKRLKRNGLNTRVEQASVNGAVWFRVRLGPAASADMLQKWQQTLSGMGISPMPVRM